MKHQLDEITVGCAWTNTTPTDPPQLESDDARPLQPDARLGYQAERTVSRRPRIGPLFLRGLLLAFLVRTAATSLFSRGMTRPAF